MIFDFQSVIGELNSGRKLGLGQIMIVIVSQMREVSSAGANAAGSGERFVQAHVSRVRGAPQRVQYDDLDSSHLLNDLGGDFFAIAQIGEAFRAVLDEEKTFRDGSAMRQGQGRDLQIGESERAFDEMGFGNEIAPGPGAVMESVTVNPFQSVHGLRLGVNRQRLATAEVTKTAAIVQSHDMVGVRMGEKNGIETADILAENLGAKIGGGVGD